MCFYLHFFSFLNICIAKKFKISNLHFNLFNSFLFSCNKESEIVAFASPAASAKIGQSRVALACPKIQNTNIQRNKRNLPKIQNTNIQTN